MWLTSVAQTLKTARAEDSLTQRQAIELAEWVEQQQLPEEGLESQVAWLVMEHCSGTPGVLDLPTLGAFLDIAAETHQPELPAPLDLIVANVTKWRPDILKWFQHTEGDVFLMQETHLTLDQAKQAKAQLHAAGLHSFWCGASPTNLTKGGIAIATKWQNHMRLVHQFTVDGCGILAVELPRVKWRLVVISVYLQTGIGLHSEPNVSILAEFLSLVKCFPNWVAAGDFNVDVDKFASTNIAEEARAEIIGSKEAAIHTGNTLDFALASRSVAPLLQLTVDKAVPFAPHFALRFHLDLKHGHVRLPQLRGFGGNVRQSHHPREQDPPEQTETGDAPPSAVPAPARCTGRLTGSSCTLANGVAPPSEVTGSISPRARLTPGRGCIGGVTLGLDGTTESFGVFSAQVEHQLFGSNQGRGWHNPVVSQPIMQDSRVVSRWHRAPSDLLKQMIRQLNDLQCACRLPEQWVQLARQHLACRSGAQPSWVEQLCLQSSEQQPRSFVLSSSLRDEVVEALERDLAASRLQANEKDREAYAFWLAQSSQGSLKPLYKCIRKHEISVERPFATFSAASKLLLRLQQWSQLWLSTSSKPLQSFPALQERACAQAAALAPLTGAQVYRYIRKIPNKTPGPDGWTPRMARELTEQHCDTVASIMNQSERSGAFPEQWTVSLIVLLPKNHQVERPIALMHILLKAWMKLRWNLLDRWLSGFAPAAWWDSCGPGYSCLDIAVRRLVQYELSHTQQEHRITLFLDLSCFYETIAHDRLIQHAHSVSFPPLLLWGAMGAYRGPRLLSADGLTGPPTYASRGVLAGCPIAVALSKVALWPACIQVLNQTAVDTADTWVDDLSVDFCGRCPHQVAAKGLRVARALFKALEKEGLEVSLKKTTWVASSSAVEAALKKQTLGDSVQVSTVAKDLGVANTGGRTRRIGIQQGRLSKGLARGTKLHRLRVTKTAHRVLVSKLGSLSAAIWGHQGAGLSPKQLKGIRSQAAQAGRRHKLGSLDVVFGLKEGGCADPLETVLLQHWRTLHKLLFHKPMPDKFSRLWSVTWQKLATAKRRWALVKGPVAALIAYLQDLGVDAVDPLCWKCPAHSLHGHGLWCFPGDVVSLEPRLSSLHSGVEGLTRLLRHAACRRLVGQDGGEGLDSGVDWTVPRRLLRTQANKQHHLTALRAVWQGAFFTTTRAARRHCPLCGCAADLQHVLLDCRWWTGRGKPPPPHWDKQRRTWPAQSLWVRALPPASYTEPPLWPASATELKHTGCWAAGEPIDTADLLFATDATGTTKDPRTRVVAAAVIACRWTNGELVEVGRLSQVLPPFTSVVQGEAMALALLLKYTKGQVDATVDCKPAIAQAQCSFFKAAHANIWEEVWEDRHRLQCTWHPSHRPPEEYLRRYGSASHWRVAINELADKACKQAAAAVPWQRHAAQVAQLDELVEEIAHFLAARAWTLLAGQEAPPLDLKPRDRPKLSLPAKTKANKTEPKPKTKQAQNRPAADGGLNKKQRLELLLAGEERHGHKFAWTHKNPNNHSLTCSICKLFIQQTHPNEAFSRLEAQLCAHRQPTAFNIPGLHPSHSFYNMGAVLLCTKCFAVHKPGQLQLYQVVTGQCEGASRAHQKRGSTWAQKYLKEVATPRNPFSLKPQGPSVAQLRANGGQRLFTSQPSNSAFVDCKTPGEDATSSVLLHSGSRSQTASAKAKCAQPGFGRLGSVEVASPALPGPSAVAAEPSQGKPNTEASTKAKPKPAKNKPPAPAPSTLFAAFAKGAKTKLKE